MEKTTKIYHGVRSMAIHIPAKIAEELRLNASHKVAMIRTIGEGKAEITFL